MVVCSSFLVGKSDSKGDGMTLTIDASENSKREAKSVGFVGVIVNQDLVAVLSGFSLIGDCQNRCVNLPSSSTS